MVLFGFDELARMVDGARMVRGRFHVPCPVCGPECRSARNRRRGVLGVRPDPDGDGFVYNCARCGIKGNALRGRRSARFAVPAKEVKAGRDNAALAADLWGRSLPLEGSPADLYLRRRGLEVWSPNLRFLRGSGRHHHAMIARFSTRDGSTRGVHLTRITALGAKADVDPVKIMLGPSAGWPIIVSSGGKAGTLCVAEGIEDAATLANATGAAAWAAGSAGRIAACLRRAKTYAEVIVAVDRDPAGLRALDAARKIRPDLVAVSFQVGGKEVDANAALRRAGPEAVAAAVEAARAGRAAA